MSDTTDTTAASVITDTKLDDNLVYDTSAVSRILGVQESTIRKYCALMRKHHYEFNKNSVGHRIFYKRDVEMIKRIADLKNDSSLTLEQAITTALESDMANMSDTTDIEPISNPEYKKLLEEFTNYKNEQMEFNKQQLEFNQKLFDQLEKQESYIKHSIEERDSKLMLALKETLETRRQIAAAEIEREKNKKLWWQFWK